MEHIKLENMDTSYTNVEKIASCEVKRRGRGSSINSIFPQGSTPGFNNFKKGLASSASATLSHPQGRHFFCIWLSRSQDSDWTFLIYLMSIIATVLIPQPNSTIGLHITQNRHKGNGIENMDIEKNTSKRLNSQCAYFTYIWYLILEFCIPFVGI